MTSRKIVQLHCNSVIHPVYNELHSELWNGYFSVVWARMGSISNIFHDVTIFRTKQSYFVVNTVEMSSLLLSCQRKPGYSLD